MATDMTPRFDQLRCADQDRELVARVLNNAYAEGRLTFDEHADRIATAYDAKTFGDLDVLTADLLPRDPRGAAQPAAPAPQQAGDVAIPGAFTGANAILSTQKSGSISTVASDLSLNSWLGEVRLDLVGATFASRHTTVHVGVLMGEVKIRVPEGVEVNTSQITNVMAETKVDGVASHPDGIVLTLVGTVIMGEVTVLGPRIAKQRKYEKFAQ